MISDFEPDTRQHIEPFDLPFAAAAAKPRRISLFCFEDTRDCRADTPAKEETARQQPATTHSPVSLDEIVLSGDSFDSFKRFRDSIFKKLEESAEKEKSLSSECPSDKSEVYSVFKSLNEEFKHLVDFDTFTDANNKKLDFVELFMVRYKQVCKDRLSVKQSDLEDFCKVLQAQFQRPAKKPKNWPSFDRVLSNF